MFAQVDVDQLRDLAEEYGIQAMPSFKFIVDGKIVDELRGANKLELNNKCQALSTK